MANEKLITAISTINRQLGVIEGVAFGLPESDQIAVFVAIETIDEALKEIQEDGKCKEM